MPSTRAPKKKAGTKLRKGARATDLVQVPSELLQQLLLAHQQVAADSAHQIRTHWSELEKAGRIYPGEADPVGGPKSLFHDPFALLQGMGWKERISNVTYRMHDDVVAQLPGVSTIINYILGEVEKYLRRYTTNRQGVGIAVGHKDAKRGDGSKKRSMTLPELRRAAEIEDFILNCGLPEPNPYSDVPRQSLREFVRMFLGNSLVYDQACSELIPLGRFPFKPSKGIWEFYAVDGSSIRRALDQRPGWPYAVPLEAFSPNTPWHRPTFDTQTYRPTSRRDGKPTRFVQLAHGMIVNEYSEDEMLFSIRHPRPDLRVNGYGNSEIEQSISNILAILYHSQYHTNFYKGLQRGLLVLKGRWGKGQIAKFRRWFAAQAAGVVNSHRIPFLELDPSGDAKFLDWHKSEQDTASLEYGKFVFGQFASVYLVDPEEVGWRFGAGAASRPLFEENADSRVRAGKQRWLPGILAFLAEFFQKIVDRIDDHFEFQWEGLDQPSREQLHKERLEKVTSYMGVDEARIEDGLEALDLEGILAGKVLPPSNPTLIQWLSALQMRRDQAAMQAQGGNGNGNGGESPQLEAPASNGAPQWTNGRVAEGKGKESAE